MLFYLGKINIRHLPKTTYICGYIGGGVSSNSCKNSGDRYTKVYGEGSVKYRDKVPFVTSERVKFHLKIFS